MQAARSGEMFHHRIPAHLERLLSESLRSPVAHRGAMASTASICDGATTIHEPTLSPSPTTLRITGSFGAGVACALGNGSSPERSTPKRTSCPSRMLGRGLVKAPTAQTLVDQGKREGADGSAERGSV
ncbi:hypothetical protein BD779DRAFT_1667846 [Infundibulicybe gibba]|nr:hypothetical protein BD779DRAFT_1667846 [Infundibulicybe gibba]